MTIAAVVAEPECCTRCTSLASNVRRIANAMELRDWRFVIDHDAPADPLDAADCTVAEDRREAVLRFGPLFDELEQADQTHAVVHELVHPLLRDLHFLHQQAAVEAYGGMAYRVHMAHARRVTEQTVDAIASVLSSKVPPFQW